MERKRTEQILLQMGVPCCIKGFRYIADAVEILENDMDVSMTKYLYPTIASRHATTASRVERAIRHAFEVARSEKGDFDIVNQYIGFMNCTNSASLCSLTMHLKEEAAEEEKKKVPKDLSIEEIRKIVREEIKNVRREDYEREFQDSKKGRSEKRP